MKHTFFQPVHLVILLMMLTTCLLWPMTAAADIGPKPSVSVTVTGLDGRICYMTLLSKNPSTGPYSAYDHSRTAMYSENDEDYAIWQAFESYSDSDGYFFLQFFGQCTDDVPFIWGYYPPWDFKMLVYLPDENRFVISEPCERYAFDSYFTVSIPPVPAKVLTTPHTLGFVEKSYDYTHELVSLFTRIALTIALEMAVALLFGYRAKRQLLLIFAANLVTQGILNILLNVVNYRSGPWAFVATYAGGEFLVFALEAVVFLWLLDRLGGRKERRPVRTIVYALTSNAASFAAGMGLAHLLPGIF